MKQAFLLLAAFLALYTASAQVAKFHWVHKIGDSGTEYPGQITNDLAGNVYATGSFIGQIILGQDTLTSPSAQEAAPFIVKYDTDGNVQWAKIPPMTSGLPLLRFEWTRTRITPTGKIAMSARKMYQGGGQGAYLCLLNADGSLAFLNDQSSWTDTPVDISTDSSSSVYALGYQTSGAGLYIAKYDSIGTAKWAQTINGTCGAYNIQYLNGQVFITGQFQYQLNLTDTQGTNPITHYATWGINDWDFFEAKYTSETGQLIIGAKQDGLILGGAAGPFDEISGEFTPAGKWRIAWINNTTSEIRHKEYTATFSTTPSTLLGLTPCLLPPTMVFTTSRFKNQSALTYYGLGCNTTPGIFVNDQGNNEYELNIPYVGSNSDVPPRALSIDSMSRVYVTNGFQGGFQYRDSSGVHTLASNLGSPDIYVGKLYNCPLSGISIGIWSWDRPDSISCILDYDDPTAQYTWYLDGVVIPGATNPYYIATTSGTYSVSIANAWGCSMQSGEFSVIISSISQTTVAPIRIVPNPAESCIHIEGLTQATTLSIQEVSGRILVTQNVSNNDIVDVTALSPGVYFARVGNFVTSFIKYH